MILTEADRAKIVREALQAAAGAVIADDPASAILLREAARASDGALVKLGRLLK